MVLNHTPNIVVTLKPRQLLLHKALSQATESKVYEQTIRKIMCTVHRVHSSLKTVSNSCVSARNMKIIPFIQ